MDDDGKRARGKGSDFPATRDGEIDLIVGTSGKPVESRAKAQSSPRNALPLRALRLGARSSADTQSFSFKEFAPTPTRHRRLEYECRPPPPGTPMKASVNSIFEQSQSLSPVDRAALIVRLLDQLEGPADENVEAAWVEEVDRRLDAYDRGEVKSIPAHEVRDRLRSRKNR